MESTAVFDFEKAISKANKLVQSMSIKGKEYVPVNERIKAFRLCFPMWSLTSDLIEATDKKVSFKAEVRTPDGILMATGFTEEDRSSSQVNKTSAVENCETSAFGRALGCLGIGVDNNFASADELNLALSLQEKAEEYQVRFLEENLSDKQKEWIKKKHGYMTLAQLTRKEAASYIRQVADKKEEEVFPQINIEVK